ncbi:MAG: hypothetical protein OYH76_05590 [Defluviicoccus sp.]|nr:hypothetical protein [Defluviicoccus sp.]MDE0275349.1 hypothetical protein [Defluviicoccus sp.]
MIGAVLRRPRTFARDTRGGAAIELALGAVVLISICAICFDLYSRVRADTASARLASTMADYVSRETEPDGDDLRALGKFLYTQELKVPANLVYAITAFRRPPGDPPEPVEVLWSDASIRFGDETVTGTIAGGCARHATADGKPALPGGFDMAAGEVLIVVEVCARLTREGSLVGRFIAGEIYRLHAVPAREPDTPPSPPAYERTEGA